MSLDVLKANRIVGQVNIEPTETLFDPVSKFRVSTPENLIDTDFEYGLQSTKWETLELINNIPTFFARDGKPSLVIASLSGVENSNVITVTTTVDHGLIVGTVIIVKGASLAFADGTYVVQNVISSTEFTYLAKRTAPTTGSFLETTTEIYTASLYQGTEFKLENLGAIVTDGEATSTITVSTRSPHGFKVGTNFILLNSLTSQEVRFDARLAEPTGYVEKQPTVRIELPANSDNGGFRDVGYPMWGSQALSPDIGNAGMNSVVIGVGEEDESTFIIPFSPDYPFRMFDTAYTKLWVNTNSAIVLTNSDEDPSIGGAYTALTPRIEVFGTGTDTDADWELMGLYYLQNGQALRLRWEGKEAGSPSVTPTFVWEMDFDSFQDEITLKLITVPVSFTYNEFAVHGPNNEAFDLTFNISDFTDPKNRWSRELTFYTTTSDEDTAQVETYPSNQVTLTNTSRFNPFEFEPDIENYDPYGAAGSTIRPTTYFSLGKGLYEKWIAAGLQGANYIEEITNGVIKFKFPHELQDQQEYVYYAPTRTNHNTGLVISGSIRSNVFSVYGIRTAGGTTGLTVGNGIYTGYATTISATAAGTNRITTAANGTNGFWIGQPVVLSPTGLGNMVAGTVYYVKEVISTTLFTVSDTIDANGVPGDVFVQTSSSGSRTIYYGGIITDPTREIVLTSVASETALLSVSWGGVTGNSIQTNSIDSAYPHFFSMVENAVVCTGINGNRYLISRKGPPASIQENQPLIMVNGAYTGSTTLSTPIVATTATLPIYYARNVNSNTFVNNSTLELSSHRRTYELRNCSVAAIAQNANVYTFTVTLANIFNSDVDMVFSNTAVNITGSGGTATTGDSITIPNHGLSTGDAVTYTFVGGTTIGGLSTNTQYFAIRVDDNTVRLATTTTNANNNNAINLTSAGTSTQHKLCTMQANTFGYSLEVTSNTTLINAGNNYGITSAQSGTTTRTFTVRLPDPAITSTVAQTGVTISLIGVSNANYDSLTFGISTTPNGSPINLTATTSDTVYYFPIKFPTNGQRTFYSKNHQLQNADVVRFESANLVAPFTNNVSYLTETVTQDRFRLLNTAGGQLFPASIYVTDDYEDVELTSDDTGTTLDTSKWLHEIRATTAVGATSLSITYPQAAVKNANNLVIPALSSAQDTFTVTSSTRFIGGAANTTAGYVNGARIKFYDANGNDILLGDGSNINDLDIRAGIITGTSNLSMTCFVLTPGGLPSTYAGLTTARAIVDPGHPVRLENIISAGTSWARKKWSEADSNSIVHMINSNFRDRYETTCIADTTLKTARISAVNTLDPCTITYTFASNNTVNVNTAVRASNIVTLETLVPHGFKIGASITVAGSSNSTFNGTFVITSTSLYKIIYSQTAADASSAGGTVGQAMNAIAMRVPSTISNISQANPAVITTTAAHNIVTGQPFHFQSITAGDWGNLWDQKVYYARVLNTTTFEVYEDRTLSKSLDTTGFSTSYVQGTNGGRTWYLGAKLDTTSPVYTFTNRSATEIGDTVFIPNHGLAAGTPVTYTTGGGTEIEGLTAGSTKYVFQPSQDRLKLADTSAGWTTVARGFTQNTTNMNVTTGVITTGTHGFTTGNQVQYLSTTPPAGLTNGSFYFVRADTATTCTLYWTKNGALNNVSQDRISWFTPITGTGSLRQASVVDITADGDGQNHALTTPTEVGTLDGLYEIADAAPGGDTTKFTLANPSNATIPKRVISLNSDISVDLFNDALYTATHGLVTGTPVIYRVGSGATSIGTLIDETEYFAIKVSNDWFRLALSLEDALSNNFETIKAGNYKGSGVHEIETSSIVGAVPAAGTLTLSAGSNIILGDSTNFTANYRAGDTFFWAFPPITAGISKTTTFSGSTYTSTAHRMMTGLSVRWNSTGTAPTNLENEYIYYVRYLSANTFQLHPTYEDAINNTNAISTSGGVGTHTVSVITTGSVGQAPIDYVASTTKLTIKDDPNLDEWQVIPVTSVVTTAAAPSVVTVTVPVNHSFAVGSVINLRGTGNAELDTEDWVISSVSATTAVFSALNNLGALTITNSNQVGMYIYGFSTATYDVTSSLLIRADSASLHRPYDGGVEIVATSSPQSKMIRQTKKYFRYQSGKGIQVSFAINFSPTVAINKIAGLGDATARVTTRLPHRLTQGVSITIFGDTTTTYDGEFVVGQIIDDYSFLIPTQITSVVSQGRPEFFVNSWSDAVIRCGLFDDQNGMFFEFDGSTLYAVRRNSTKQIGGFSTVQFGDNAIIGTDTSFSSELTPGDLVVIKGQSYKVVEITNNTLMYVQPSYRGADSTNVVISKTSDLRFPQSQWNIDPCDGTGPTGYNLDIHKIQMAYMDYSWYGAGKVRFGFKDGQGVVRYVHDIIHNNLESEAYMRSGNLPARYEVFTGDTPTFIPNLAHWGTSVIMDGGFSEDKAYLFSATSNPIYTTSATPQSVAITGVRTSDVDLTVDQQGSEIFYAYDSAGNLIGPIGYALQINTHSDLYYSVTSGNVITNTSGVSVRTGTRTATPTDARVGASPYLRDVTVGFNNKNAVKRNLLVIDKPPANESQTNSSISVAGNFDFTQFIPLLSIRLAPSVDNGVAGGLGSREIINRMQLTLQSLDILSTHECEMQLVINPDLDNFGWRSVNSPSLSQVIYHSLSDTVTNGSVVFSFQIPAGSQQVIAAGASQRELTLSEVNLSNVATLGNSILGGDGVYPDGPDVLTLRFRYLGLTGLVGAGTAGTAAAPFRLNARISWAESQA